MLEQMWPGHLVLENGTFRLKVEENRARDNQGCLGVLSNNPQRVQQTPEDQRILPVMRMNYLLCLAKSKITIHEEVEKHSS